MLPLAEQLSDKTIYVIDDEEIVLRAMTGSLEAFKAHVSGFQDPKLCLRVLENTACDLIISDVNMPGMDGLQFLERAKKLDPRIPVIIITGYADYPLAVRAIKLGAVDFIEKPFDEDKFIELIASTLQQASDIGGNELTQTERQVLSLIVHGKCNKEIAFELDRSIRTIENHRHRMMKKLAVDSTAGLVALALKLGLVHPG